MSGRAGDIDGDNIVNGLARGMRKNKPGEKTGLLIHFYHVPTVKNSITEKLNTNQAVFKAFLTSFKDSYKVNWNPVETLNRMDAIQTYKNTQRTISISFEVPSWDLEDAKKHYLDLQRLIQMQYPVYEELSQQAEAFNFSVEDLQQNEAEPLNFNAADLVPGDPLEIEILADLAVISSVKETVNLKKGRYLSSPPLIYVGFKNWIGNGEENVTNPQDYGFSDLLVVTISDVSFQPDLEMGTYYNNGLLIPKEFKVDLNMTVIHTEELGWVKKEGAKVHTFGNSNQPEKNTFPYKIKKG